MKSLIVTLSLLFLSIIGPLAIDNYCNGCITGRGLAAAFVLAFAVTAWHVRRVHRQMQDLCLGEILLRRKDARENFLRRLKALNEQGEVDGDLTNWLLVVAIVAILFFLISGYCSAADGAVPICGEPTGFQMMAVGLVGLVLLKRRTPR